GRHEVSVGDLPAAAMGAFDQYTLAPDNDPRLRFSHGAASGLLARRTRLADMIFQFHEGRPYIGVQHLAPELDGELGRIAVHAGEKRDLDALQDLDRSDCAAFDG